MGHQFFERLAGRHIHVLQVEMEQERPDLARAADAACKTVHYQVQQLLAARDLERIQAVIKKAVGLANNGTELSTVEILIGLRGCVYRDEAERIALQVLGSAAPGDCTLDDLMANATFLFANQLSRSEVVFRLPRDGPQETRDLGDQLAHQISQRAITNLRNQRSKDPNGWRDNKWRAPRARAKKSSPENLGNDFDVSR
jgi:hypothetical protein